MGFCVTVFTHLALLSTLSDHAVFGDFSVSTPDGVLARLVHLPASQVVVAVQVALDRLPTFRSAVVDLVTTDSQR